MLVPQNGYAVVFNVHAFSVEETSFADGQFDRIFHTNCYYFWPSKDKGSRELYRILKPDGLMVTALNMAGLKVGHCGVASVDYLLIL